MYDILRKTHSTPCGSADIRATIYGVLAERNRGDAYKTKSLQNADFTMTSEAIQTLGDDIVQEDTFADFHGAGSFSSSG